jgi:ferrous iron transport protein B
MRHTTQRGAAAPFIMELPEYHAPQFKSLMIHLWDKAKHFVKKAFTIILASTIVIWFLSNFSFNWQYLDGDMSNSILAGLGQLIQPLFTPLGFGSQLTSFGFVFAVAAVTGLIAKENVIATFAALAAIVVSDPALLAAIEADEEGIEAATQMILASGITWQGCISFIAFNMLTIPCFAACATAKAELPKGQFKWTILFWLAASYVGSATIYVFLSMFSLDTLVWAIPTFVGIAACAACGIFFISRCNKKHPVVEA